MRKLLPAILILSLTALPLAAQGFFSQLSYSAELSILVFPGDDTLESDPMPILPSPGAAVSYPFAKFFRAELGLDFYYTHYGWSPTLQRAVPAAIENRSALVIGSVLSLQAVGYFDINSFLTIRAFAGPSADLRLILLAEDLTEGLDDLTAIRADVNSITDYFWSEGRWFLPVAGTGIDFTVNENFRLGIDLRCWFPLYRLWTGEDLGDVEGWRFGGGIRLTIR
jgi:hypothetical protein